MKVQVHVKDAIHAEEYDWATKTYFESGCFVVAYKVRSGKKFEDLYPLDTIQRIRRDR